jgi:hypothetical protein
MKRHYILLETNISGYDVEGKKSGFKPLFLPYLANSLTKSIIS